MNSVLYIHGKGGNADECEHYGPLFPDRDVIGLDYKTFSPKETGEEIQCAVEKLKKEYENVILIANSIGAFFSMNAKIDHLIEKAYFISPIVDMEKLILDMTVWANVTEAELKERKVIKTGFGEDLSWDYLRYVREHPVSWSAPTHIIYGENDNLTSRETVYGFASRHNASLSVMAGGEHWFHTEEQLRFIDDVIKRKERCTVFTDRLKIYPASMAQMEELIEKSDDDLRPAYTEMLTLSMDHPDKREWYAAWMIESRDGEHIGDICFKGLDENGIAEIGYGICEEYRGKGYASEAVSAVVSLAFEDPRVEAIEAETELSNKASQRVLEKCGFIPTGTAGEEGPRFILKKGVK